MADGQSAAALLPDLETTQQKLADQAHKNIRKRMFEIDALRKRLRQQQQQQRR